MSFASKIILGTAQFGQKYGINNETGVLNQSELDNLLRFALVNNIDILDTAVSYGNSEDRIGAFHESGNKFKCITKICRNNILTTTEDLIKTSIEKIGCSVYGVLLHNIEDLISDIKFWEQIIELKNKGLCKKIGVSIYSPSDLEFLKEIMPSIDIIQLPYNIFDRRFEKIIPDLKSKDIDVHSRSVFLQGLFFQSPDLLDPFFLKIKNKIKSLNILANDTNISLNHILLGYCLLNHNIQKVIIGVDTLDNLKNNLKVYDVIGKVEQIKNHLDEYSELDENIILPINWKFK